MMFDSAEHRIRRVYVFCINGELLLFYDDCHNDHHIQSSGHKTRLQSSCGNCFSAALSFEHSCQLEYDLQTLVLRSISVSYYESDTANAILQSDLDEDENSTRTALPPPGWRLCLPILLRVFSCDRQQCFLYVRAHQCISLQDDCDMEDLLHNKTNPVIKNFNTDKETERIRLVEQTRKSNSFTSQVPYYPREHVLIKTKFYLPYKI